MEFRILGPLEIVDDERTLELRGPKQRALLTILLLHANEVVSQERLLEDVWGERRPHTAAKPLHGYVSQLRKVLESTDSRDERLLVTRAPGYELRLDPEQLDLTRFERLAAKGKQALAASDADEAAATLREALSLWRGQPFAEFSAAPFALVEGLRLEELRLSAIEDRIEADLALGRHGELVAELETLVSEHPHRERLWGYLMLALYRSGRQAEALDAYQRTRRALVDELGIEPGTMLQELERAILNHDPSLDLPTTVEGEPAQPFQTNLPIPATPFLGREKELDAVVALILREDVRLLTLTGPGGTGKTRLAIQAAAEAGDRFPDGVWWVPLAALRDPFLVVDSASRALGARNGLDEHIRDKTLLLLFDNFEQVAEAAPGVSELLASCPNLQVVVTSRERLHVAGEQEYAVPPFAHEEGIGFFLARARAVKADFEADEAVSEICRRLDDLPLALELAAARVKALTSTQILERLEQRLPLLTGGARDLPERQRTLRATIDWSYDLLGEDEQRLFSRLSVFSGGCTLEASEDVAEANVDTLQSLVDKSLVRFTSGRYWMLETMREFAGDALAASPDAEKLGRQHAEYYLRFALEAEPGGSRAWGSPKAAETDVLPFILPPGPAQALWLDRLGEEHDNLRAALDWSLTADPDIGLRIVVSLGFYWEARGHGPEARNYVSRLLALDPSPELRALALRHIAQIAAEEGELEDAERYAEERERLCRELGDEEGANWALKNVGRIAEFRGDLDRANAVYREVLAKSRELGMDVGVPLLALATVAWKQGRFSDAEALFEESLAFFDSVGDDSLVAVACLRLAAVHIGQGRRDMARAPLRRGLSLWVSLRYQGGIGFALEIAAVTATDARTAARLLGKSDELREEFGRFSRDEDFHVQAAAATVDALGKEQFDAAHAAGRALSLDDAVALALEVIDA